MDQQNTPTQTSENDGDEKNSPRSHELPEGELVVADMFRGHARQTFVIEPADRQLYELLVEVLSDVHIPDSMPARLAINFDSLVGVEEGLRDIERGVVDIGNAGYGMSYAHRAADAISEYRDRDPLTLTAVGCSGSKYDDPEPMPAKDRYKGAYWVNKRGYAELADDWAVISAEHDVLHPETPIHHYERVPDDWRGVPVDSDAILPSGDPVETRLDLWALYVYEGLMDWLADMTDDIDPRAVELEILLGKKYRTPLEERGVFTALRAPGELTVSFPFQEVEAAQGGMFEQIAWMSDVVEAAENSGKGAAEAC